MAIDVACVSCGRLFTTSASSHKMFCNHCDGTEDREKAEARRWAALSADQKADELLARVNGLEQASRWDGRIG